jgi:hypothetical protein
MNMLLSKTYDTDATVFYGAGVFFSLSISFKLPTHLNGSIVK